MYIDYLTITCNDPVEFERCRKALTEIEPGEPVRRQEFYGFVGARWEKEGYGTRFVGTRDLDGFSMISASGKAAHTEAERLRFLSCWQPSRVDVAVDVERHFDVPGAFASWQGKTRTKVAAIADETLYVGSRKSQIFWRIYNKAIEMGKPELAPLWRFEIELKGDRAKQFWGFWQQSNANLPGIIRGYLRLPDGNPREPSHSIISPYLDARENWHIGPLPRRRRAGEAYFWQNVLPFLRDNWEWAGPLVIEQLIEGGGECTQGQ
jgi:hypothetical protein